MAVSAVYLLYKLSHRTMECFDNFISIQQFSTSYPEKGYIILINNCKKANATTM